MGKDQFLKLLIAQLQNQDPMNPMQGDQMASQLAQFSSLEQLQQINTTLTGQQIVERRAARRDSGDRGDQHDRSHGGRARQSGADRRNERVDDA